VKPFWPLFDALVDMLAGLAGAILVFIVAAVCYSIGLRYFFTKTVIWIIQTTEYALLWIVFLSTTWLLREGGHICTDILHAHLEERGKRLLDVTMFAAAGLACGVVAVLGALYVRECILGGVTDVRAVTVPKSAVFGVVPLGSTLLTIQFLRMAWGRFRDGAGEG
jgi:TRAP-type C4-dicarboxylate transport system permease small subunit